MTFGILAVVLVFLAALAWRSQELGPQGDSLTRSCPNCQAAMVELTDGVSSDPPRAYQVFACSSCSTTETTVHGTSSSLTYCPSCRQRGLALSHRKLGDGRVHVEEGCQICGHHHDTTVPEVVQDLPTDGDGKVIPFKRRS